MTAILISTSPAVAERLPSLKPTYIQTILYTTFSSLHIQNIKECLFVIAATKEYAIISTIAHILLLYTSLYTYRQDVPVQNLKISRDDL